MTSTRAYAVPRPSAPLAPFSISRRDPGPEDILIDILYCGVCHSDIHQARDEWQNSSFPMVPGHEIVGRVTRVGKNVRRFRPGDLAGVGCFVDSCRRCPLCKAGQQQFCAQVVFTYNSVERDGKTPTFGGYSERIVVAASYAFKLPKHLPLANVAPLLCAGITTYAPLRRFGIARGKRVGVIGLGGLGHMAVKLASSMGAEVTVFSRQTGKEKDARRLGAASFVAGESGRDRLADRFDLLIDTVSAPHEIDPYLALLRLDGAMALVGVPEKPAAVHAFSLIGKRRTLTGSLIGGIPQTQEMLDYCGRKKVTADVEVIPIQKINEAYDRTVKGDVRYRFVIDMKSLSAGT